MSLNRTALRWAAIAALRNGGKDDATMAGSFIFDTRLDPLEGVLMAERVPVATVFTPGDTSEPVHRDHRPPFEPEVTLVIEIAASKFSQDDGILSAFTPETDSELEFQLDLFEYQVKAALFNGVTKWSKIFAVIARKILKLRTVPVYSEGGEVRMASRQIIMAVNVCAESYTAVDTSSTVPAIPDTEIRLGSELPALLASFVKEVRTHGTGEVLEMVNGALLGVGNSLIAAQPRQRATIGMGVDFIEPKPTPGTVTPDGVIEIALSDINT